MNNTQFAVMQSERGTLTVVSQQSNDYWQMQQTGTYTEVETGTKRQCEEYVECYLSEHFLSQD